MAKRTWAEDHSVKGLPQRFIRGHQRQERPVLEEAKPFKLGGVYCRLIPLSRGLYTIVGVVDYEWLMRWKWFAHWAVAGEWESFYVLRGKKLNGKRQSIQMAREILGLSPDDERQADHINHDTLDHRRCNLRIVTSSQSNQNKRMYRNNTSGFKGVSFYVPMQKWLARIKSDGRSYHLGYFYTREEAAAAYRKAADRLHGEFACYGL